MIAEIGHFALVLALMVAILQSSLPLWGAATNRRALVDLAQPAALLQCGLVIVAFAALMHAYATSDFSLANVWENSHSTKPFMYKISGLWSNHEGSMLLWVLILTLYGAAVALFGTSLPPTFRARVLAVHGMIGVGFLTFILLTSNPFLRLDPVPPDGRGMNPVLQDPGLAIHPPFLYLGYVGFSMAFSFAVAALIEGRVDAAWARWVRPWTLVAWCALTLGICLGSFWAYYELGWGGWWAWDPVENASFMPWLSGTALLHSAIVVEKRDTLKSWTIFLALVTFALSLVGTFLVRSGVLTSVHAFASDPERGAFILVLLGLVIGGSLLLFAIRAPAMRPTGQFAPLSREGALVFNNLLLSTAALTVFLGTLYPLFLDTVGGPKVSVGAPWYNATFVPLMVPMLVAMAGGPMLTWKRGDIAAVLSRLKITLAVTLAVIVGTLIAAHGRAAMAPLGTGLAAWIFCATLSDLAEKIRLFRVPLGQAMGRLIRLPRAAWGMTIAHAGLAVTIAGMTVSTGWNAENIQVMRPGDSVTLAGDTWRFEATGPVQGSNWTGMQGSFTISDSHGVFSTLHPSRRTYTVQDMTLAKVAIHTNGLANWYAVIGDPQGDSGWIVRLYWQPLVPWIWFGALIMAAGGAVSLSDRRLRIGAPVRRAAEAGIPHVAA